MAPVAAAPCQRRRAVRALAVPVVLIAVFVAAQLVPIDAYLADLRGWIRGNEFWGGLAFVLGYAAATALGLPGIPLTILAALLFGIGWGFAVMIAATLLASAVGFGLARGIARRPIERWLSGTSLYKRFCRFVDADGWLTIPLCHVMPVFPYTFVNYAFGLTKVSFSRYIFATALVMIPMNAIWVATGDAAYRAVSVGEVPWQPLGLATAAGLALVGLAYLVKRAFAPSDLREARA